MTGTAEGPVLIERARCFDGISVLDDEIDILIDGGRIAWIGTGPVPRPAQRIDAHGMTVMPGLIDLHVHLEMPAVADRTGYLTRTSKLLMAFHAARNAHMTLLAGFTTLRNMGSESSVALRQAIDADLTPGPRLLTAGIVDMTGGHFDLLVPPIFPRDPLATADGVGNVRQLVRRHVRSGADFIKFATTGGIVSEGDEPDWCTYSADEVRAIVEESRALKRRVACHAQGTEGIRRALQAGVDTLEHGTFMDDECVELLVDSGAVLVPTLSFFHGVVTHGKALGLPSHWIRKCGPAYDAARESVRKARTAGAKIAYGTDSAGRQAPHGRNAGELSLLVDLGFSPLEALVCATSAAAAAAGLEGETGRLREGYSADLVLVRGDPAADIDLLTRTDAFEAIFCKGRRVIPN